MAVDHFFHGPKKVVERVCAVAVSLSRSLLESTIVGVIYGDGRFDGSVLIEVLLAYIRSGRVAPVPNTTPGGPRKRC